MIVADKRWQALFAKRHAWAYHAYDAFMSSLSPDVRERMGHKSGDEEAYVVAFGQTQVGKTTLIIDLMGVAPEAMQCVSTVLRGGRAYGRSATSTAMEYRRSPDDCWGLRIEDSTRWIGTDAEMTLAIGGLRESMEARTLQVTRPCLVYIPAKCFSTDPAQTQVRMLDLPGDQPANPVELEHVHDMARQYIPLADLILLIGRSDDLTFLQPGRLTLPCIENWQSVPARFRVVTTYSFAAKDVRDEIRSLSSPPDLHELRESLLAQIELAGPLSPRARRLELFFPLEFGNSWLDVRDSHPDLYSRVAPLVDDLKQQLRHDISESTGSWARLKNAVSAYAVVQDLVDERLTQMELDLAEIGREVLGLTDELTQAESGLSDATRRLLRLQKRGRVLSQERLREDALHGVTWPRRLEVGTDGKTVPGFRMMMERTRTELIRAVSEVRPLNNVQSPQGPNYDVRRSFWRGLSLGDRTADVNRMVSDSFLPFVARLVKYRLDRYWFTSSFDSDYQIDVRMFEDCLAKARRCVEESVADWWCIAAEASHKRMRSEMSKARVDIIGWEDRVEQTKKELASSRQRLETAEVHRTEYEQRMHQELAESRRFARILDERYLQELRSRRDEIIVAGDPSARLLSLMAAVQMADARTAINRIVTDEVQQ